ncbi:hypothetical protein PpBr36_07851 [Pyricularia pennisetigena]|uniref:hypothetical protein n=1 Tax=Pyricularia pennisetigena TaxID=1578925 RepID=UPI001150090B|nr:hypothetical protein PpBr36_07851 [Pyricularia pennisetigena]TLS25992.1 hypothetical protein PpBr36_07851 [Pyricularia pennisetigena]
MRLKVFAVWGLTLGSVMSAPMPRPAPEPAPEPAPLDGPVIDFVTGAGLIAVKACTDLLAAWATPRISKVEPPPDYDAIWKSSEEDIVKVIKCMESNPGVEQNQKLLGYLRDSEARLYLLGVKRRNAMAVKSKANEKADIFKKYTGQLDVLADSLNKALTTGQPPDIAASPQALNTATSQAQGGRPPSSQGSSSPPGGSSNALSGGAWNSRPGNKGLQRGNTLSVLEKGLTGGISTSPQPPHPLQRVDTSASAGSSTSVSVPRPAPNLA